MKPLKSIAVCSPLVSLACLPAVLVPLLPAAVASPAMPTVITLGATPVARAVAFEKQRPEKHSMNRAAEQETPGDPVKPVSRLKTAEVQGDFVGPVTDCDGDGLQDDSRIDFDGDGVADDCVSGREAIPEPPFQQSYTPTADAFYALLPAVGWQASYQCGDGLWEVTLRRPSEDTLQYVSQGLTLESDIVYDEIDPNLNQPLVVRDPVSGLRYRFSQEQGENFYEYAIADYDGSVGLYVYQMGEQIVATPCTQVVESAKERS